jgi:hypothetical protein
VKEGKYGRNIMYYAWKWNCWNYPKKWIVGIKENDGYASKKLKFKTSI